MAIVWDAPLTAALADELRSRLGAGPGRRNGARLQALHLDHGARSVLLWFREGTLVFRLDPDAGSVLLLDPAEPVEGARRLSATLDAVECRPDDRVLLLTVRKVRGGRERFLVAIELMTNQWNAVVAEGEDRRIRHVLRERRTADRALAVGSVYELPPASTRAGADGDLSFEAWRALLDDAEPGKRRGALLSGVAWTSSINADALLGDAVTAPGGRSADADRAGGKDEDADGHPMDEEGTGGDEAALRAGFDLWRRLAAVGTGAADPEPVVLAADRDLQPYPLPLPGFEVEPTGGVLEAVAAAAEGGAVGVAGAIPSGWIRALKKRAASARGRIRGLERELERAPDPGAARALGDLILARFHQVPAGVPRAELDGFDGETVEVELDPALSAQENAAAYYDEATRSERARERLPGMIEDARAEAERLEALLERVEAGEADAAEVEAELPEKDEGGGQSEDAPSLPYRRYRSSGGLEIRVGRGSKRNDELTFHHSRPDDVWLHARHTAGAHVILRWDGEGNPPARDLAEAAVLAALASKARTSGSVPVDWTRRKYVRSPRKAPPGTVLPDRVQTVFVEPDPSLEERLRME